MRDSNLKYGAIISIRHQLVSMRQPKRRANLLYKLRRRGIRCGTKQRCIYLPYMESPKKYPQIPRLCREFHFYVQFIIT